MDLLDRLLGHDAWTTRRLLECAQPLTPDQWDQSFEVGLGTLRATFRHVIRNMQVWSDLMAADSITTPISEDASPESLIAELDRAAIKLATVARSVAARDGWDEKWLDTLDNPPTEKSFGGAIAHVITHSMHHRGQIIFMLRALGVKDVPEGDVLSWEHRAAKGQP